MENYQNHKTESQKKRLSASEGYGSEDGRQSLRPGGSKRSKIAVFGRRTVCLESSSMYFFLSLELQIKWLWKWPEGLQDPRFPYMGASQK